MEIQREIAILEYSNREKVSINEAKVQLARSAMDNQTKRDLAAAQLQLQQNEGEKNRMVDLHKHNTSLVRDEMITPDTP